MLCNFFMSLINSCASNCTFIFFLEDFPSDIANKSLSESASTMLWKSKGRRRRTSHPAAESSSEQGASEADIDSDSGYCSPKHGNNQAAAMASRNTDSCAMNVCKCN